MHVKWSRVEAFIGKCSIVLLQHVGMTFYRILLSSRGVGVCYRMSPRVCRVYYGGMIGIVHDVQQFWMHSLLRHFLQRTQRQSSHRLGAVFVLSTPQQRKGSLAPPFGDEWVCLQEPLKDFFVFMHACRTVSKDRNINLSTRFNLKPTVLVSKIW